MNLTELWANPNRAIALFVILGFVLAINLPLLFPTGLSKYFEREAKIWGKALRGGSDIAEKKKAQLDELHKKVEELKSSEKTEESQ